MAGINSGAYPRKRLTATRRRQHAAGSLWEVRATSWYGPPRPQTPMIRRAVRIVNRRERPKSVDLLELSPVGPLLLSLRDVVYQNSR